MKRVNFFIRAGTATVRPTEGSDNVLGSLGSFNVSNNTQLGLTFTYMATDNIGVELLAATRSRHKVGTGPTGTIATVHQLPPTLMAQWYFGDAQSKVRPYVGAGINYTTFFNEDFNDTGKAAGLSDLSLKDSWGAAGQVGLDYLINRDWLLNMSVWYMDIDTDVEIQSRRRGPESQHPSGSVGVYVLRGLSILNPAENWPTDGQFIVTSHLSAASLRHR